MMEFEISIEKSKNHENFSHRDEKSVCVSSIEVITHLMTVFEGMSVH